MSMTSETCIRYYHQKDIPKVVQALYTTAQHVMYSKLCDAIIQYWEIPKESLTEKLEMGTKLVSENEDNGCRATSLAHLGRNSHDFFEGVESEKFSSCVPESSSQSMAISCPASNFDEPGINKASSSNFSHTENPGHQQVNSDCTTEHARPLEDANFPEKIKLEPTISSGSVSQQTDCNMTQHVLGGKLEMRGYASSTSGKCNSSNRVNASGGCIVTSMSSKGNLANCPFSGRDYKNVPNSCISKGSTLKATTYINNYTNGDFAASAAANLAILLRDDNPAPNSHAFDNGRKVISANVSLQLKAFSSAVSRFFWPNSEKKHMEVPRERCGWCLSCKAPIQTKKACLLNAAALNATRGTMKILAGICPVKNREGSLFAIAAYLMFMEESLCGLTDGPFQSPTFRKQWRQQAERASTFTEIKSLLLEVCFLILAIIYSSNFCVFEIISLSEILLLTSVLLNVIVCITFLLLMACFFRCNSVFVRYFVS